MKDIDVTMLPSPCYLVDERLLEKNLKILDCVQKESGAKIILATKAFSMFSTFPLIGKYLNGVTSSSLFEARLGYEEMGKEVHIFSPAYRMDEFNEIMKYSDHIIFNSFNQWKLYRDKVKNHKDKKIECGIRINPEYSEIETDIYNPCFENSRMGVTLENFEEDEFEGIDGLHFHTMCEQGADVLERTIKVVDEKFGKYIEKVKWINFGGGHHITREGYELEKLIDSILYIKNKYNVDVYLEPGEAIERVCEFLNEAETYYLATVENDQPRVRPFGTANIFEGKLYIQTGKVKNVSKQLSVNPKAEICAFMNGEWLRLAGTLVEDDRVEARQSMLDAYPSLQKMYAADDGNTQVLYFKDAIATFSSFTHEPEVIKL